MQPIPIIGGGIAGLTAALSLSRLGVPSIVHERAPALEEIGAGLQLSPNAWTIIEQLGLGAALEAVSVAPQRIAIRDGRTDQLLATVPLGETVQKRFGAPYRVLHRANLQKALLEACEAQPAIALHLGSEQTVSDLSDPLVIAADGVRSAARAAVRATETADAVYTGYTAWRALRTEPSDGPPETRVWLGPGAHLVDYPVKGGGLRNLVAIARQRAPESGAGAEGPGPAFKGWHRDVYRRLSEHSDWTPWALYGVDPAARWTNGRIALTGDAAHAMLPFAAQGAAMAIEDAHVLAEAIALIRTGSLSQTEALTLYETTRKPRVGRVWHEASRNGRIYHMTGPAAFARNAVMRARSGQPLLERYAWLYGWKPSERLMTDGTG